MTLKEHIDDIRDNVEKGLFTNEAAVSHNIVLRLLDVLGWPRFNPQVIIPEYSVGSRRVDFALCHPSSKPIIFIEVKQSETSKDAEQQLFEYAFHEGVPIAILADEQKWQFFHPSGQGNYRERKVYELDLRKSNIEEGVERLNRYLNYNRSIRTGKAVEAIKKDYESVRQQKQVAIQLPAVWDELVQERNEYLLLAVMEKAKKKIGHEPTEEQVLDFLKNLKRKTGSESIHPSPISPVQPTLRRRHRTHNAPQTRLRVTMPDGNVIEHPKAIDTWIEVIVELGPERVLAADEGQIISTSPNFRSGRPEVQHDQYYIAKDYSTKDKKRLLEKIALRLSIRLKVEIVEKL